MFIALVILSICPNSISFIVSAILSGYAFGGLEPSLQAMAVNSSSLDRRGALIQRFYVLMISE